VTRTGDFLERRNSVISARKIIIMWVCKFSTHPHFGFAEVPGSFQHQGCRWRTRPALDSRLAHRQLSDAGGRGSYVLSPLALRQHSFSFDPRWRQTSRSPSLHRHQPCTS